MRAFHGKQEIKDFYINRVRGHELADQIVHGYYRENGKGCAVGCTIHDSSHAKYETELGIPRWLAHLEDRIFEGLKNGRAKIWPRQFLEAIKPGADLEKIKIPMLIFIVESARANFEHKKYPKTLDAINNVLTELNKNPINIQDLRKARAAADAADAAYASRSSARQNEFIKFADKLLELMQRCE